MVGTTIRSAEPSDTSLILSFIRELAEYERLAHEVVATEDAIRQTVFGDHPRAEVLIAEAEGHAAGFALYFHNYSTFLARPGLFLEDLFVRPEFRRRGIARELLTRLAAIAVERQCGRFEWSVLDWNMPAINFYKSMGAEILPDWRICRLTAEQLRGLDRT